MELNIIISFLLISYGWMAYEFANAPIIQDEE